MHFAGPISENNLSKHQIVCPFAIQMHLSRNRILDVESEIEIEIEIDFTPAHRS